MSYYTEHVRPLVVKAGNYDRALIRGDDKALKGHLTALAADLVRGRDPREVSAELRDLIEGI